MVWQRNRPARTGIRSGTPCDFLAGRVPDFAISAVMGHTSITLFEWDRLFAKGSPTAEIYKRRQLQPVPDVGQALEAEWWPEIVKRSATLKEG